MLDTRCTECGGDHVESGSVCNPCLEREFARQWYSAQAQDARREWLRKRGFQVLNVAVWMSVPVFWGVILYLIFNR